MKRGSMLGAVRQKGHCVREATVVLVDVEDSV